MNCEKIKESVYKWLDDEMPEAQKGGLLAHLEACPHCRKEAESIRSLNDSLRASFSAIEPSRDFERVFWQAIAGRSAAKEPWFIGLLKELDSLVPHLGIPQMAMAVLTALLVGGAGGIFSAVNAAVPSEVQRSSAQYLSGFNEFKGVPSPSVAASYLKVMNDRSAV
ncbi:MAG: zf-HC2 domain-containing protein [Candidatus Omnitrophica bacterium]|nr:zf-HC2 domain-containing protein [Candidatus Omnitrophota bacterium]